MFTLLTCFIVYMYLLVRFLNDIQFSTLVECSQDEQDIAPYYQDKEDDHVEE